MIINYISKTNSLIDRGSDAFSESVILPTIKLTYRKTGDLSVIVAGVFSRSLWRIVDNLFHDPVGTSMILFVSKRVEDLTSFFAGRKPFQFLSLVKYLDRSLISMNQQLNSYTKRINELLSVPKNLKLFLRRFSFVTLMNQMKNTTPSYLIWMNYLVIQVTRLTLKVLDLAIRVLDFVLTTTFFGVQLEPFSYLKMKVIDTRKSTYDYLANITIQRIEKREAGLRRQLIATVAESATDYLGMNLTRICVKSLLGLLFYIPTKDLLRENFGAPEWVVHTVGAAILTRIMWSNVVRPTCDPYYETYDPKFNPKGVSFLKFCWQFGIIGTYPITAFAAKLFGAAPEENT